MMSRAVHAAEQRRSSVSDGEEEKWDKPSPASPRGTAATSGVQSPLHHCTRCLTRAQPARPVKWRGRLTSGPRPYFIISRIFNHLNFKIRIGTFPLSKIHQIIPVDRLKHKEQLYFLDQHQNPSGLQVTNSGTNSNFNFS
jgi:hypothetical protein